MNTTNWTGITDVNGLLTEANSYAPFWGGMLYMVWFVLVITFIPFGIDIALIGGSFSAFTIGIFLVYMGLINFKWLLSMIGVIIATVILKTLFSKKE